jgi:hypothetical protein
MILLLTVAKSVKESTNRNIFALLSASNQRSCKERIKKSKASLTFCNFVSKQEELEKQKSLPSYTNLTTSWFSYLACVTVLKSKQTDRHSEHILVIN